MDKYLRKDKYNKIEKRYINKNFVLFYSELQNSETELKM